MIKNERQYKITKNQVKKFSKALAFLQSEYTKSKKTVILKAQVDAMKSQIDDLNRQIEEYDLLQQHRFKVIKTDSLEDIPRALVQGRIALGLSQKELALRLGMKEQQMQRYEATDYASASLTRIIEVAKALNLKITKSIQFPDAKQTFKHLFSRLKEIGLNRDFIMSRLIPPDIASLVLESKIKNQEDIMVLKSAAFIGNIYGWNPSVLLSSKPLILNDGGVAARFKMPRNKQSKYTNAYIVYAHYLALLVLEITESIKQKKVVNDAKEIRENVISKYNTITFENLLSYVLDLGIPVLPLKDSGAFHGACWRIQGRNIIVLKQKSQFMARWAFDLLHELYHSGQFPEKNDYDSIDINEYDNNNSPDEKDASLFAGNVLLNGRAEELTAICVKKANGKVELLKSVVPTVAKRENVELDYLANYLAFRLSLQNINWWGTATNLQQMVGSPWEIARDRLLQSINLADLNEADQRLLQSALAE